MSPAQPPNSPVESSNAEQVKLLTVEQVAARWQVPKAHVYRLAREGHLPTVELGRYRRWRMDAIDAFEREGGGAANA